VPESDCVILGKWVKVLGGKGGNWLCTAHNSRTMSCPGRSHHRAWLVACFALTDT
jgi:hypothetical protein